MVTYWKLGVLIVVAAALWLGIESAYNARAANFLLLAYALLTIKFYQWLDYLPVGAGSPRP